MDWHPVQGIRPGRLGIRLVFFFFPLLRNAIRMASSCVREADGFKRNITE